MNISDIDIAQMHVDALFVYNDNAAMVRVNEPEPSGTAPRFFMTRTIKGNIWRARYDLPDELTDILCNKLAPDEPISRPRNLPLPPKYAARYKEALERYAPIAKVEVGPAFWLPEGDVPEQVVTITQENIGLVERYFGWLQQEPNDYAPVMAVVEDGAAVAVCFSSRLTAAVAEAGVNTEAAYRGRGYAPDVVRGWAAAVRASGRLPLYSTSWENKASKAVARKVGAMPYAMDFSIT
jgi:RimJ/RimL family protein N-acetyltransferase